MSYATARAVHFKGSAKPWRVFSCFGLREGRLRVSPAMNSTLTLTPNDVLSWDDEARPASTGRRGGGRGGCVSRVWQGGGVVVYGHSGEALPRQCCRFTSLLKAEWWHHYRAGAAPPSLGQGDSWVRLGRWERRKNGSDMEAGVASHHGLVGGTGHKSPRGTGMGRTRRGAGGGGGGALA